MTVKQTKSTKTSPAKKLKTSAKAKKSASASSPKGDVCLTILTFLYDQLEMGVEEVKEEEVVMASGYARPDSTGFRVATKTLLKELHHAEKALGKWKLTDAGKAHVEKNGGERKAPAAIKTNADRLDYFKEKILKMNSKVPQTALDSICLLLSTGRSHSAEELLQVAGYKRKDATGYREIMKMLKKFELLEKVGGNFQFSDKAFITNGRPINSATI